MNDVAAITCFLNLENDSDKVDSFIKFKNKLKDQGVPLFTIEIVPEGKTPDLVKVCEKRYFLERTLLPILIEGNALNVLSSKVPKEYKKIAWLKNDLLISDDDWAEKASWLLEEYKLVRLNQELKHESPAIVNRDFFETVGIFDLDFCGASNLLTHLSSIEPDLLFSKAELMNLYKESNLDIFYKLLSYRKRCYDYFEEDIKILNMEIETLTKKENSNSWGDFINLLKDIKLDHHINYEGLHKIIGLKNIHKLEYSNKMLHLLK